MYTCNNSSGFRSLSLVSAHIFSNYIHHLISSAALLSTATVGCNGHYYILTETHRLFECWSDYWKSQGKNSGASKWIRIGFPANNWNKNIKIRPGKRELMMGGKQNWRNMRNLQWEFERESLLRMMLLEALFGCGKRNQRSSFVPVWFPAAGCCLKNWVSNWKPAMGKSQLLEMVESARTKGIHYFHHIKSQKRQINQEMPFLVTEKIYNKKKRERKRLFVLLLLFIIMLCLPTS